MKTGIVWFTNDLRLHDNEVLVRAVEGNDRVVPVYCLDERHYCVTKFGFRKTGAWRAQFILEALQDLHDGLSKMGAGLLVVRGRTEDALATLAKTYNVSTIYTQQAVAYEELQTQQAVAAATAAWNCRLEAIATGTLYRAEDMPFDIAALPEVFTDFRRGVERHAAVKEVFKIPAAIVSPELPGMELPSLGELGLQPVEQDARAALILRGGERAGMERVHYYLEGSKRVSTYKQTRNELIGPDYSTKFSAWLAAGCLSPRYIYAMLKAYEQQYGANESTYWVVFELLWRDYFRFMMQKHGRRYFLKGGIKGNRNAAGAANMDKLMDWVHGRTGVDFVDANMQELRLTGFMSNRGRQNVASYLCHDMGVDWRYGAAYFEEQLTDYDVCSNWCNWAYVAGVGNDPRGDRYFNIAKQAQQYDADGRYRALWLGGKRI